MTHTSSSSSLMKRCDITKKLQTGLGRFSVCWLVLVCVIPSVRLCLQCDLAVRHMHEDFMASKHEVTVQEQMDLTKIIDHAYITYQDTSTQLSGVIGVYGFIYIYIYMYLFSIIKPLFLSFQM